VQTLKRKIVARNKKQHKNAVKMPHATVTGFRLRPKEIERPLDLGAR